MTSMDIAIILGFLALANLNSILAQLAVYYYKIDVYGKAWDLELWCEEERTAFFAPIRDALLLGSIFAFLYGLFGVLLHWQTVTTLIVGAGLLGQGFFAIKRFFFIFASQTFFWPRVIGITLFTFWLCPLQVAALGLLGMIIAIASVGGYYLLAPDGSE